jgi:hypothetical protein
VSIRLPRVNHGLKRLVLIGSDGFITLEALRWISDVGAAFVMLDRRGKVLTVTGPGAPSDSKLRRAQSLSLSNGTALKISKELISQKLAGQESLVRDMLHDSATADGIARFKADGSDGRIRRPGTLVLRVQPYFYVQRCPATDHNTPDTAHEARSKGCTAPAVID